LTLKPKTGNTRLINELEFMKKIGIFYWPLKGNVEKTAQKIAEIMKDYSCELISLNDASTEDFDRFDFLIFGNSTVGAPHWEHATTDNKWYVMFHQMEDTNLDLHGKKVAFFTLGDQVNYPHNFVDSLELVHCHFKAHNITHIGEWPNEGYEFYESKALNGDKFLGLVLDLDNQPETLQPYAIRWCDMLREEFI
jgi:flavodoxin I